MMPMFAFGAQKDLKWLPLVSLLGKEKGQGSGSPLAASGLKSP